MININLQKRKKRCLCPFRIYKILIYTQKNNKINNNQNNDDDEFNNNTIIPDGDIFEINEDEENINENMNNMFILSKDNYIKSNNLKKK